MTRQSSQATKHLEPSHMTQPVGRLVLLMVVLGATEPYTRHNFQGLEDISTACSGHLGAYLGLSSWDDLKGQRLSLEEAEGSLHHTRG